MEAVRPYLVQRIEEFLVISDMPQLILVLVVALEHPIGWRGHDEMYAGNGQTVEAPRIPTKKFVPGVQLANMSLDELQLAAISGKGRDDVVEITMAKEIIDEPSGFGSHARETLYRDRG
jgi:hypothetical protein